MALSADAQLADREAALAAGVDDFVVKPFRPEAPVATLEKALRR